MKTRYFCACEDCSFTPLGFFDASSPNLEAELEAAGEALFPGQFIVYLNISEVYKIIDEARNALNTPI